MLYLSIYFLGFASTKLKPKNLFFYLFFITIILLACFRFGVGPDYFGYKDVYFYAPENISEFGNIQIRPMEFLFEFFNIISKKLGFSYQIFISIICIISLYFVSLTSLKFSENPLLSLVIYYSAFYFIWTYSGIRQGMVTAIGLYFLIDCKLKGNHFKFFVITSLLFFIHNSAFILAIFYFFALKKISPLLYFFFLFASIVIFYAMQPFILDILSYLPLSERAIPYFTPNIYILDYKGLVRILLMICFGLLFINKMTLLNDRDRIIYNLFMLSFLVYFPLRSVETAAQNLSVYGFMALFLLLPNSLKSLQKQSNKTLYSFILFIFMFFFLLKNLESMADYSQMKNDHFLKPYTHIFSPNCDYFGLCKEN